MRPFRDESRRPRLLMPGWRRAALLSSAAVAFAAAPIALADSSHPAHAAGADAAGGFPLRGAIHNPPSSAFFRTTGLFSKNGGWTSRVQNQGSGGAALDACSSASGGLPCLDAENLKNGLAFIFNSGGNVGGEILLRDTNAAPLTTNAHGVATGLNANFVQGKQATDFVNTGQLLFADVDAGPTLASQRGATAVTRSGDAYTVTFGSTDVSKCAYTASPQGGALTSGQLGVQPASGNANAVTVNAPSGFSGGFDLQVVC